MIRVLCVFVITLTLFGCASGPSRDPYKNMSAKDIYARGTKYLNDSNYDLAVKAFEGLESHYPYGEYSDKAHLAMIYSLYKKTERAQSLASAERFIRIYPRHSDVDYAYYMRGMNHFQENMRILFQYFPVDRYKRDPEEARLAFHAFKQLVQRFPNSPYNTDARQRMVHLKNQLADYEFYVAKHYYTAGSYLAAVARANTLLTTYSETAIIPEALQLLSSSYTKLGMFDLANEVDAMFQANYSNHNVLAQLD